MPERPRTRIKRLVQLIDDRPVSPEPSPAEQLAQERAREIVKRMLLVIENSLAPLAPVAEQRGVVATHLMEEGIGGRVFTADEVATLFRLSEFNRLTAKQASQRIRNDKRNAKRRFGCGATRQDCVDTCAHARGRQIVQDIIHRTKESESPANRDLANEVIGRDYEE